VVQEGTETVREICIIGMLAAVESKIFAHIVQDRDQLENSELAAKEASEGMPRNVQDFKNHPYYALERHLRHNEIIHPKQEAGRLNIGTSTSARFETVYRRKDVHVVRSADKWFRLGRDVRVCRKSY
jgi:xeroderma pigmentosum group C-complementing protein